MKTEKIGKEQRMDIRPYMPEFGFGRAGSRHIIVEQDEKLWLAFASEGAGVFMMSSDSLSAGLLEINLMHEGQSEPYTYEASEALLKITSAHGKVSVAVDACAKALRFVGEGVGIRLDSKDTEQSTTNLNTPEGTVVSMGGGRYVFVASTGQISFDDTWVREKFRSKPPLLDVAMDGGKVELIAYDLPADTEMPAITKTLDECVADNEADFKQFCSQLITTPSEYDDVRANAEYLMWVNQREINGVNVILSNKLRSADLDSVNLSIASLVFTCPTHATNLISSAVGESPIAQASAVIRLFKDDLFKKVSRKTVFQLYDQLRGHMIWWTKNRTDDDTALFYYAYRYEAGNPTNLLFKADSPIYSPDINTYMILACKALAKLSEHLKNFAEVTNWKNRAADIKHALIANLWDGEKFVGKNLYSGEKTEADEVISLMPLALGGMLPKEIADKLAEKVTDEICDPFIILGLFRAGYEDKAKQIMTAKLKKARETGIKDPFDGAALLALAKYVL